MSLDCIEIRFRALPREGEECLEQTVQVPLEQLVASESLHPVDALAIATSRAGHGFWQAVVMSGAFEDEQEGGGT